MATALHTSKGIREEVSIMPNLCTFFTSVSHETSHSPDAIALHAMGTGCRRASTSGTVSAPVPTSSHRLLLQVDRSSPAVTGHGQACHQIPLGSYHHTLWHTPTPSSVTTGPTLPVTKSQIFKPNTKSSITSLLPTTPKATTKQRSATAPS